MWSDSSSLTSSQTRISRYIIKMSVVYLEYCVVNWSLHSMHCNASLNSSIVLKRTQIYDRPHSCNGTVAPKLQGEVSLRTQIPWFYNKLKIMQLTNFWRNCVDNLTTSVLCFSSTWSLSCCMNSICGSLLASLKV